MRAMVPPSSLVTRVFALTLASPSFAAVPAARPWAAPGGGAVASPAGDAAAFLRSGTELYKAGVYDKAALAFEAAWGLQPTPTTALNLAQSLEGAGRPAEALTWYGRVLAAESTGPRHDAAAAGIAHLGGHGFVSITCSPATARLDVAGTQAACPTWHGYLPAGEHAWQLSAEGRPPRTGTLQVRAGERVEETLELPQQIAVILPTAPPAPASDAPGPGAADVGVTSGAEPAADAEAGGPVVPAWLGYTLLGVGAAGLIVGGLYYSKAADDADAAAGLSDGKRRDRLERDFDRHATVGYTGLGLGGALLVAGGAALVFGGTF